MSDEAQGPQNFPPTAAEDLMKLGVESRLIPFFVSTALRVKESPDASPPLTPSEAEDLVEILDKVLSSTTVDPSLKNTCSMVLRKVSPSQGVLPKSYFPTGVTLSDTVPYSPGGFADIWKGELDGNQVCVKAFRTQTAANRDNIKRRFYREIVAWKYVSHPNVVPFLGVSEKLFWFSIISPWLSNGNIIEYTKNNQGVDRLRLLSQAASGLEHLHSLNIVHSDINPGNIMIGQDGIARLGDFGITGVITDPTVVEPGSATASRSGAVRYMAPELLDPTHFNLSNSDPSKESDIYSLAMTIYETLAEIQPYGNARDGVIIFQVVSGDRPSRPTNTRWLQDKIWDMITICWNERRELRWDIHTVYNQLSASSMQEIAEGERDAQTARAPNIIEDVVPKYLSVQVEDHGNPASPAPPVQPRVRRTLIELARNLRSQSPPVPNTPRTTAPKKRFTLPALAVRSGTGTQLMKRPKKPRSQTVPVPSVSRATASQRRFTLPLHRTSRRSREQSVDPRPEVQGRGAESAIVRSSWGWKVLWVVVKALGKFLRVRKLPGIDRRLSAPHDSDPSEWECVIGGLIDVIFSDRDEVKAIGQLSGGDAQVFTDMVYEALDYLDPVLRANCLQTLSKICGRQALLPRSLSITVSWDPAEAPLYQGGCADVWRGRARRLTVAIKVPRMYRSDGHEKIRSRFCKEVVMWSGLRHPNVLPLLGAATINTRLVMVSEWMANGTVNEFVKAHPDADRLGLLMDTVSGVVYLHEREVIHGDLKGANVLVDHNRHARIADFGLLRIISDKGNFISSITCAEGGTLQWMGPELLDPESFNLEDSRPTKQSDVYALGMVIYEVLSGQSPFPGYKDVVVLQKVMGGERPQRLEGTKGVWFKDGIWEMLELCWKAEWDNRPSLGAILQCLEGATPPSRSPSPTPTVDIDPDTMATTTGSGPTVLPGGDQLPVPSGSVSRCIVNPVQGAEG